MTQPERVELGPLQVSRLCLGTMLMGGRTTAAEAHRMLDAFVAAGHNFVDTADVYGDGAAERVLAPWLARRRGDVVVTTKVRFPVSDPGGEGLAPERIRQRVRREPAAHGHRRDRPLPDPCARSGRRAGGRLWRRSTASCARARCAPSGSRTSRPGCSRGPCGRRTARGGRRSWPSRPSTRSSSGRPSSTCSPAAARPASASCPGARSAAASSRASSAVARRRTRGAAWPRRPTTSRRRCTGGRPSATSTRSRRRGRSPPTSGRPCRRSPSRGCCTSPASPRRCSVRAPPSSSRTSCPRARWISHRSSCTASAPTRRRPSSTRTACSPSRSETDPSPRCAGPRSAPSAAAGDRLLRVPSW